MGTKPCTECEETKSLEEFYKQSDRKDGRASRCKNCVNAHNRKMWAQGKRRYSSSKLQHRYGITLAEYNEMLETQSGSCAICGVTPTEHDERLCVDHNHETGKVRGLLCSRCNLAIGILQDSPELCQSATDYLLQE